eukprot:349855-Chlamydomonas_euryale.AAC.11
MHPYILLLACTQHPPTHPDHTHRRAVLGQVPRAQQYAMHPYILLHACTQQPPPTPPHQHTQVGSINNGACSRHAHPPAWPNDKPVGSMHCLDASHTLIDRWDWGACALRIAPKALVKALVKRTAFKC